MAHERQICGHRDERIHNARPLDRPHAFSLIEMLLVISIIIILISITMPALSQVRESAWMAQCTSNLRQIHETLLSNKMVHQYRFIPPASMWMQTVAERGSADVRVCPKGVYDTDSSLEGAYLVQNGNTFSYLEDIVAADFSSDPQLGRYYQGNYRGDFGESQNGWENWSYKRNQYNSSGRDIAYDDMAVVFNDDGGVVVELTSAPIRVVSLDPPSAASSNQPDFGIWTGPGSGGDMSCGSNHWLCIGEATGGPTNNWQQEIVMQLTGNAHQNVVDPPVRLSGGRASYGMNNQVYDNRHRGSQVLLLDYKKTVVDVQPDGNYIDDMDEWFAPRHFGKANVMRVDGSVSQMSRADIEFDPDIWVGETDQLGR